MVSKNKCIVLAAFTGLAIIAIFVIPPIPQPLSYHQFGDSRRIWGISNFFNVVTNFPFILTGSIGLYSVAKSSSRLAIRITYGVLFIGVVLTGFGSAFYHLEPNNNTLVWDRYPMTIVFMALLSATIYEVWSPRMGTRLLAPFLILGIGSVWWWHFTEKRGAGDLRLYLFVQFYPVLFIPLLLWLFYRPALRMPIRILSWVVFWYVLAKVFEQFDSSIYRVFPISGHSLKHLAAAVSTWYFVLLFRRNYYSDQRDPIKVSKVPNLSKPVRNGTQ
jgi:ceramidase